MPNHSQRRTLPILTAITVAVAAGPAPAQDNKLALEEVIVTAQKRVQSAQDVPIAMTVETGDTLQKKGITTLEGLSYQTPSLYSQDGGRVSSLAIRGLGSPGLDTVESSVGIYIDEIYFGRSRLSRNPLFDMERIEVLRGPQGTLYGRNTIAGAISMYTARPTSEFEASILAEGGNLDSYKFEGYLSGPLIGGLSGRFAALNSERGTYLDNEIGPDGGGQDTEGYRGSLLWEPSDSFEVFAKYEHMNHENEGIFDQLVSDPFGVWADYPGIDLKQDDNQQVSGTGLQSLRNPGGNFSSDSAAIDVTWDIAGDYRLRSVTGWTKYDARSKDYITASPEDSLTINGMTERTEYWSQELRIESPADRRFHFIAGGFFDNYDTFTIPRANNFASLNLGGQVLGPTVAGLEEALVPIFGPVGVNIADGYATGTQESFRLITPSGDPVSGKSNLDQVIQTWSVFFEGTFEFSDKWHGVLGVRYLEEENSVKLAKGTYYRNGDGLPWGAFPTGSEITAAAQAADPALAALPAALLDQVYDGVNANEIAPGVPFTSLPLLIAAPGGTPRASDSIEDEQVIPSGKLQYFHSDDSMFYLTVATGFKAGGFNSSNINTYTREGDSFDNEDALSVEVGGKLTLLDGSAQFNFAVFRTEFDDLQVSTITPQGASTVLNASSAVTQGIEIDATWRLTDAITIGGAYAYLDAEYEDSEELSCGGYQQRVREQAGEDFSEMPCTFLLDDQPSGSNELQRAPEHTASLWGEYFAPVSGAMDLQVYGGVTYRDESSTSLDNYFYADDLTMFNGRIALYHNPGQWSVALFGNNLLDEDGLVLHQDNSGGAVKGIITTPRTYGLQLVKQF